ncbi:MAG: tRNA preQ1(34) S-adenosylmethionine ribosyltransferase-isomerase QueA [Bacilli bacterium]|nr:tRNA preQ1(34) S-adenosylmethionine ribosyltransferase-isomerase QueA [Bacilli bacterium]
MRVEDFNYYLPPELIAQTPLEKRSDSRLLVLDRKSGGILHDHFYHISDYLQEGDVLVLNDTKVMPSRIYGKKVDTQAVIEFLLLKEVTPNEYESLVKPARRIHVGTIIDFSGLMQGEITAKYDDGMCHIRFHFEGIFFEILEKLGEMPLPPYIHEKLIDQNRYQTVYAKVLGSAAAPTAGLHFTPELISSLQKRGIQIVYLTLHVGLGTFRPVSTETVEAHHMHSEYYEMNEGAAQILNQAKREHRRIISVGTTSTRTLESIYGRYHSFKAVCEETNIFIYPGYQFVAIDGLITNFHLPKSSLVMLVSAFSSRDIIIRAYQEAINKRYRFFSFGDAMFIK